MKRLFLQSSVSVLLVALGFAQTPAPSSDTGQIAITGCLSGADGNYTVAEDNTGRILKLTGSSVDLKTHLGQDVKLVGHKATGAETSGAAENSLAVTELTMISEHCVAAAAVLVATVSKTPDTVSASPETAAATTAVAASVPSETTPTPPAGAPPNAIASTDPTQVAAPTPAGTVTKPSEIAPTPPSAAPPNVSAPSEAVAFAAQAAPAPVSVEMAVAPPGASAVVPTLQSARSRKPATTTPAAVATAEAVSAPAPTVAAPDATLTTPAAPVSQPLAKSATSVWSGSPGILVSFIMLVLVIGALTPLFNRWRKRKLLEQTSDQNLSFTHRASSDPGNGNKPEVRKAA